MELNEFIKLSEDAQVEYLLKLDIQDRKEFMEKVKTKNKMLSIKLSGKVQSKMNIHSKVKADNFISIFDIKPNPNQPRKTITDDEIQSRADSIRSRGLLQPIRIYFKDKTPYLISGQIRLAAYKLLNKLYPENEAYSKIKYEAETNGSYSDYDLRIDALTENLSRKDMFVLDTAFSVAKAFEEAKIIKNNPNYSTRDFEKEYGIISASQLTKYIKICTLDKEVIDYIKEKNFNRVNFLYQIAKEDISNEKRIELIDNAIEGKIKTVDVETKQNNVMEKVLNAQFINKKIESNIKTISKQLKLLKGCSSQDELLLYTSEIKRIINEIEKEF